MTLSTITTPVAAGTQVLTDEAAGIHLPLNGLTDASRAWINPATAEGLAAVLAKLSSDPATNTTLAGVLTTLLSGISVTGPITNAQMSALGLATQTTLASVLSALQGTLAVSGPITNAQMSALGLATQTTAAAILAKLSADPATQTTLAAVLAKLSSDPATAAGVAAVVTALGLATPAGENHIGEVGSAGGFPTFAPTVSTGAYASGQVIGTGVLDLTGFLRAAGRGALLQSARLCSLTGTGNIDLVVFNAAPAGTYTDKATYAPSAADIAKIAKVISVTTWIAQGANGSVANVDGIGRYMNLASGTTGKLVLVARGAVTFTGTADLTGSLGVSQD